MSRHPCLLAPFLLLLLAAGSASAFSGKDLAPSAPAGAKAAAASLLGAARECAQMVSDDYERAAVLARIAEVEYLTGADSGKTTVAQAEQLGHRLEDRYKQTLTICEIARVKELLGEDPVGLLREAETAAEAIRVEATRRREIWDTIKAIVQSVAGASGYAPNPLQPPPWAGVPGGSSNWYADLEWYRDSPSVRRQKANIWLLTNYISMYAARREEWEAQQRHLRDLARAAAATAWCTVDAKHGEEIADRIDDPFLHGDTLLCLARLSASANSPGATDLCLRALEMAQPPINDERTRACARAVCALMIADPEKAREPLREVRAAISGIDDPSLRILVLGDLMTASRRSDPALAAVLFGEAAQALDGLRESLGTESLLGLIMGTSPVSTSASEELLTRGSHILSEGFGARPDLAAEACVSVFQMLGARAPLIAGQFSSESVANSLQSSTLRLLALHDVERAIGLVEESRSRLARATGYYEIGAALALSQPARAQRFLDRAWELADGEFTDLKTKVGVDDKGKLKLRLPRWGIALSARQAERKGEEFMAKQAELGRHAETLSQIVTLQARIAVATRYAGGEQAVAVQRCQGAVDTIRSLPEWSFGSTYGYMTGAGCGLVTAAMCAVDRDSGEAVAEEMRELLERNGRATFATSAAAHLSLTDPTTSLEFLIEAVENAPERASVGSGWSCFFANTRVFAESFSSRGNLRLHSGRLSGLSREITSAAKGKRAWAGEIARALAELALVYGREEPGREGSDALGAR